jgi:hypothetical protein
MNRTLNILSLICFVICMSACDYVNAPYKPKVVVPINTADTIHTKNAFIEDYTGMWCENCPPAADEIDSLIKTYGSRIIPVSINTGYYATPPLPAPYNGYNFTSATGDLYAATFGIQNFPSGFVNRKGALAASPYIYTVWGSKADSVIRFDTAKVQLSITTQFADTSSRNLTVNVTTKFLYALSGTYNLVVLLTEDSMIAPQNRAGTEIKTYAHRYALRDAINSTWGDALATGSYKNQSITKTYNYKINASYPASPATSPIACNFKHCTVVAYVYDATQSSATQYVVLQSQQKKIYP